MNASKRLDLSWLLLCKGTGIKRSAREGTRVYQASPVCQTLAFVFDPGERCRHLGVGKTENRRAKDCRKTSEFRKGGEEGGISNQLSTKAC